MKVKLTCPVCKQEHEKENGAVTRAKKKGAPIYCGRKCAGIARRTNKTEAQKKEEKRLYDMQYRENNKEELKVKKAAWFKSWYDPEKAREERKKTMPRHVAYCRQPEYKAWKRDYDRKHRAKRRYGEYWESHLLAMAIRDECLKLETDYSIRYNKGRLSQCQKRKREISR